MVLRFLMIAMTLMAFQAQAAKHKEIPIQSGRSIREQVGSLAEMLEKEMPQAKNKKEQFKTLSRITNEIRILKENNPGQEAKDESYMDLLLSVLESLPKERAFKVNDCEKYQNDFINEYEPSAEENPTEPAVLPGWKALQALCQKNSK